MHPIQRLPKNPALLSDNTLHVISVISNPCRYHSRFRLYEEFAQRMAVYPEVHLVTVEAAFGDRAHEVTSPDNPDHVQLRTTDELWIKENMVNLGIRALPRDWKYVAWLDADIEFLSQDWAQETLHQLQHHKVVQPFSDCVDLGPEKNVLQHHKSFCSVYRGKQSIVGIAEKANEYGGLFPHPGFAWSCRREWYENVGGLLDVGILGASDHHMALGMIGAADKSLPGGLHPNYNKAVLEWQDRCERSLQRNLGFVKGTILHHWHGPKRRRFYIERWSVLQRHQYDPMVDTRYDQQGLLALNGNKPGLRDDLRAYFRSRWEDSMDEDG